VTRLVPLPFVALALWLAPPLRGASPASGDGPAELLVKVDERVRSYYDRLTSITCTESVTQEELKGNFQPNGKSRAFVYDLVVIREPAKAGDAELQVKAERRIKSIDGRAVDAVDLPHCTDPVPAYSDPLDFLLSRNQARFKFETVSKESNADATVMAFAETSARPTTASWKHHCFEADGGRIKGRMWIEPATGDVMKLQTQLAEPFRIPVPGNDLQDRLHAPVVERSDTTVRFKRVPFENPEETLLLPESIVTVTVMRAVSTPRMQTTQTFTNFRRFMTEVKVKDGASSDFHR